MNMRKQRITLRKVLAFGAIILLVFVLALIAMPASMFPFKSFLDSQKLLQSTISFFGIIIGGFIAGLILTVVHERIQTYSWRRDQALKDIDAIYEPLYWDVTRVATMAESLDMPHYPSQVTNWGRIKDSYLGTKLRLMEERLYEDLQRLFDDYREYAARRANALDMVATIAKEIIEKRLDERIAKGNYDLKEAIPRAKPGEPVTTVKDEILAEMPKRLNWGYKIFTGLLKGKPVREWSASKSGDENTYLQNVVSYVNESDTSYFTHIKFGAEEIQTILDELYHEVQADTKVNKSVAWCEDYSQRAQRLKSNLEVRILRPQLP
jgi:hypothetical protein